MFLYKQNTLKEDKNVIISLQKIYGISWYKSLFITSKLGFNFILLFKSFNFYNLQLLFFVLDFFTWLEIRIRRYDSQQIKKQVGRIYQRYLLATKVSVFGGLSQ